jgi:glycosyltransferase involved in cell wall biosynthesis
MKVLFVHNYYQAHGGEDRSVDEEAALLRDAGHEVFFYAVSDASIPTRNIVDVTSRAFWNPRVYRDVRRLVAERRPDVVHLTNTFPLISPAACHAAKAEGAAVVQALHNYRLLCPSHCFVRDGRICEECLGKRFAWPAIRYGCYRGSRAASAVVAAVRGVHDLLRTWRKTVDLFATPSEFASRKFVEGGFSPTRLRVIRTFVDPDPGAGQGDGGFAVFVGRLASEKGLGTLLDAWNQHGLSIPLRIIGDGPLADLARRGARENARVEWLGERPWRETLSIIGRATCLIVPSVGYETFGRTIIEGFAVGTPVIASRLGPSLDLIDDGRTGWFFTAGDAADLADRVRTLCSDPELQRRTRVAARAQYEAQHTRHGAIENLLAIYHEAQRLARTPHSSSPLEETADARRPSRV